MYHSKVFTNYRSISDKVATIMRFILIAISVLLASCSNMSVGKIPTLLEPYKMDIRQGNAVTPELRARLKFGMTKNQVHIALGTPLIRDPFHADRWDYYYSFAHQGELVKQSRLTLYFAHNVLVRINDNGKISSAPPPSSVAATAQQSPSTAPAGGTETQQ
jgi:outer membrane protein assembly factor BamE